MKPRMQAANANANAPSGANTDASHSAGPCDNSSVCPNATTGGAAGPAPAHLPRTWVAVRLGHLGDVLLATGALAYLAETRGWTFHILTSPALAEVFLYNPHVQSVIAVDTHGMSATAFAGYSRNLAAAYADCGLLDLHGSLRSRVLSAFWKGPVRRYEKMSMQRRIFLNSHGTFFQKPLLARTVAQRYVMAVDNTPPPASCLQPEVFLSPEENAWANDFLSNLFPDRSTSVRTSADTAASPTLPPVKPVALHPYATHALKTWPEHIWKQCVTRLEQQGIPWIITGRGTPLFPGHPQDLTNRTSLRESFSLLAKCSLLVSGDSGPMHMAGAVNTPVVALFGPTTREWGFFPQGYADTVLEKTLACRPCSLHGKKPCPRKGECLTDISVDEVLAALARITGGQ
ncbi:glycosyltransferase family 9 protein [Desulfovibrio sp. OttesenSCG-928-G15]|nr:glycosyltransferase family 9 protein [Desulfovibrio sp. OttesenSCG-928-G15]